MNGYEEIILGWDNGNGTSVASAEIEGHDDIVQAFFPSVYAIGQKGYAFMGEAESVIDPTLNGNTDDFYVTVGGSKIWGGQSAYMVRGNPINPSGFTRYENTDYMSYMYLLTLRALINGGLRIGEENHIHMTVGMPPKIFYEQERERREIMDAFKYALRPGENHNITLCNPSNGVDCRFYVTDLTFTAEGSGGYYDAILNDDLTEKPEASDYSGRGVLIVDVGRYTFDAFILVDNQLGEEAVFSDGKYGLDRLFEIIKDKIGSAGISTNDIERHHYTNRSRIKQLRDDTYGDIHAGSMNMYLNELSDALGHYSRYTDRFDPVLVMGGIVTFADDQRMFNNVFSVGGHPVHYLDPKANAEGYRKFAKVMKAG